MTTVSGMSYPPTPMIKAAWYVIAREDEVRDAPLEVTLCERELVLWRPQGAGGEVCAIVARCPHRGANLARGEIIEGCISCPYHGWRFDSQGACVHIPSRPKHEPIPAGFKTPSVTLRSQQGLIWAWADPDREPDHDPPTLAALSQPKLHTFWVSRQVKTSFVWWVDNMLDTTHVPFTHAASFGGAPDELEAVEVTTREDEREFIAKLSLMARYAWWARVLYGQPKTFSQEVTITHQMPGTTTFEVIMPGGKRQTLISLTTPMTPTHTKVWLGVGRNYLNFPGADWFGRRFVRKVLDEDERLGHEQMLAPDAMAMSKMLSVAADAPSLEFFRLMRAGLRRQTDASTDDK